MARLIDEIRIEGRPKTHDLPPEVDTYVTDLYETLADRALPVFVIDNVAEYYHAEEKELDARKDFPNLAPPYPAFWLEYVQRSRYAAHVVGRPGPQPFNVGTLIKCVEIPTEISTPARWVLCIDRFLSYGDLKQGPLPMTLWIYLGQAGEVLGMHHSSWIPTHPVSETHVTGLLAPQLLAVCFLHCKNVTIEDIRVPKPLAKKWHAKHNLWPAPYKTLTIEPLKKILQQQGNAKSTGLKQAMHICRGHFKDYREGRGLFGKYHVLVWHDAVVRGTKRYDLDEGETPPREIQIKLPGKSN